MNDGPWLKPSSKGDKDYTITRSSSGGLECECSGFQYRKNCRHIKELLTAGVPRNIHVAQKGPSPFLTAALEYEAMGYHVIPVAPGDKKPMVAWKEFQHEQPSIAHLMKWWSKNPDANVGIILGQNRFAVDLDGGEEAEELLRGAGIILPPDAPRSKTKSGFHVFLSSENSVPDKIAVLRSNVDRADGSLTPKGKVRRAQVDVRGLGFVIVPPSIHPSGVQYEWIIGLVAKPPEAPQNLIDLIHQELK